MSSQLAAAPPEPPWEQIPLSGPRFFLCERGVKQLTLSNWGEDGDEKSCVGAPGHSCNCQ